MIENAAPTAICFGEILWDSLEEGLFPGGAPANVAYHLNKLGTRGVPVTAVGRDVLGEELLAKLAARGIETAFVSVSKDKPTGIARVSLRSGSPIFEIVKDVAWDWIEPSAELFELAPRSYALIFGTLAQRCAHNREQFARLRNRCARALQFFDVNLRPPFDDPQLVWDLADGADVIKLNHDELSRLLNHADAAKSLEAGAREFARQSKCGTICVTAGDRGAGLLQDERWYWENARPVQVCDTVGAGDAFLAALVDGMCSRKLPPPQLLNRACRLAEYVASRAGATPPYSVNDAGDFIPG